MFLNFSEFYTLSSLNFQVAETLATMKGSLALEAGSFDFKLSATYTPTILRGNIGSDEAKLLNANFKTGISIPGPTTTWRLNTGIGADYSTLFVKSGYFGFSGAIGPEFSTSLIYGFGPYSVTVSDPTANYPKIGTQSHGGLVSFNFKFALYPTSDFSVDLSNSKMSLGLDLRKDFSRGYSLGLQLEYSSISIVVPAYYLNTRDTHFMKGTFTTLALSLRF